jgi:coiled-coil domain-containing protein 130
MSSLAAARADNFYYDPLRFDPKKKNRGSANALAGSHPLGERARRIKEGILVIRFEMPYDSWCLGCNVHIARGVRYNADKTKTGNYMTTPIYEFRMKCVHCDTYFVIRTDPKNADYEYVSGIRKKVKSFSAKDAETMKQASVIEREALETHKIFKLEHKHDDERKAVAEYDRLAALEAIQQHQWGDSYSMNSKLRKEARVQRKAAVALEKEGADRGYSFPMLPEVESDKTAAHVIMNAARVSDAATDLPALVAAAVSTAGAEQASALESQAVLPGFVRGPLLGDEQRRKALLSAAVFEGSSTAPGRTDSWSTSEPSQEPRWKEIRASNPGLASPQHEAASSVSSSLQASTAGKSLKRVRLLQETHERVARARLNPEYLRLSDGVLSSSAGEAPQGLMGRLVANLAPRAPPAPKMTVALAPAPALKANRLDVTGLLMGTMKSVPAVHAPRMRIRAVGT